MKVKAGSFILMDNCWLFTSCFCPKETCLQWSLLKAAASSLWPLLSTGPSFNSNVTMKVSIEAQNGGPIATIIDMFNCTTSVVPRPLPGFILQPWRKNGGRFFAAIFLHGCEIQSGSGLGEHVDLLYHQTQCVESSYCSIKVYRTVDGDQIWYKQPAHFSRNAFECGSKNSSREMIRSQNSLFSGSRMWVTLAA